MRAMIHRGSTGKVLLTRGPLFYQPERSRAAISHSASKQCFKLCRRDFIPSYLPVYRSSRVRVHRVKMWGNGGWRCIEHTAPQRDWKTQISRMWEGEMEEVVRHYSCTLSVGSGYVLHQADLERYLRVRESPRFSFHRESACTSTARTILTASAEGSAWLSQVS